MRRKLSSLSLDSFIAGSLWFLPTGNALIATAIFETPNAYNLFDSRQIWKFGQMVLRSYAVTIYVLYFDGRALTGIIKLWRVL
jgi:hypothetical protein